jgi:hypothetical protein
MSCRAPKSESSLLNARRLISALSAFALLALLPIACSKPGEPQKSPDVQKPSATQSVTDPQPVAVNACSLLSAQDATRILGARVRSRPTLPSGCAYEEKPAGSEQWESSVSLSVRQYQSAAEESSAWDDLKLIRHLEPGRKNLVVLSGLGKEAYLESVPDRNAVDVTVIVHQEKSDFQLKEVTDHSPSPEALKAAAAKIAGQLP